MFHFAIWDYYSMDHKHDVHASYHQSYAGALLLKRMARNKFRF